MLLRKIEELRKRPKEVRNRYAFGAALSMTLVIAIIWGVSLPSRVDKNLEKVAERKELDGPTISEQLIGIRSYFGESLNEIQSQAELVEVTTNVEEPQSTSTAPVKASTTAPTSSLEVLRNMRE